MCLHSPKLAPESPNIFLELRNRVIDTQATRCCRTRCLATTAFVLPKRLGNVLHRDLVGMRWGHAALDPLLPRIEDRTGSIIV